MVSGFVTSPCDQLRMRSGEARLMRMLSKSVMLLPKSNGLERYKVSSVCSSALSFRIRLWRLKNPYRNDEAHFVAHSLSCADVVSSVVVNPQNTRFKRGFLAFAQNDKQKTY